jgi:phage/plasmid primase-like uncharacterized protein
MQTKNYKNIQILDFLNRVEPNRKQKRIDSRQVAINCIFHNEKSPSLQIDKVKNVFHCKGCEAQGNNLEFIKKYYNCDAKEVFKKLESLGLWDNSFNKEEYKIAKASESVEVITANCNNEAIKTLLKESNILKEPTNYLINRGIKKLRSNKVYCLANDCIIDNVDYKKDTLLIPIYNNFEETEIIGLQAIDCNNNKKFIKGSKTNNGLNIMIANNNNPVIYLVEGVADALAINQVGYNALVYFSKGNLLNVIVANHKELFEKSIIFSDLNLKNSKEEYRIAQQGSKLLNTVQIFSNNIDCKDANDLLLLSEKELIAVLNCRQEDKKTQEHYKELQNKFLFKEVSNLFTKNGDYGFYYLKGIKKFLLKYKQNNFIKHGFFDNEKEAGDSLGSILVENKVIFDMGREQRKIIYEVLIEKRKDIDKLTYSPVNNYLEVIAEEEENLINEYKPSGLEAKNKFKKENKSPEFSNIKSVLMNLVNEDEEGYNWLIKKLAWELKFKGIKHRNILILAGVQGSGKTTYGKILREIYGENCKNSLSLMDLDSNFNFTLFNSLQNIVEEASDDTIFKNKKIENKLKQLSGSNIGIKNSKFFNAIEYPQLANYTILSNAKDIINLDNTDTRYSFFWSEKQLSKEITLKLFANKEALFKKEVADFYNHLLVIGEGLKEYDIPQPYINELKNELIEENKNEVATYIDDDISGGDWKRELYDLAHDNKYNNGSINNFYAVTEYNNGFNFASNGAYILNYDNEFLKLDIRIFRLLIERRGLKRYHSDKKIINDAKKSNNFEYNTKKTRIGNKKFVIIRIAEEEAGETGGEPQENNIKNNIKNIENNTKIPYNNSMESNLKINQNIKNNPKSEKNKIMEKIQENKINLGDGEYIDEYGNIKK